MQYKIAHVISSIDTSTGGPARSVTHLIGAMLDNCDHEINLFSAASKNPIMRKFPKAKGSIDFCNNTRFGGLRRINEKLSSSAPDLLHGHGLWQLPVHQMATVAKKRNIPYIITPRGMLEPWSLGQGKWKKSLALKLYQTGDLRQATCIHATAPMEAMNIRQLGFTNPIAVIPNGIDLTEFPVRENVTKPGKRTLLFLSRIHQKKGIEILLEAWDQLDSNLRKTWRVEIAGNGEENYIRKLKEKIRKKGLQADFRIIGPQFGIKKLQSYHRADLFVLPTYSENFGIVVAEAMACGIPVITTEGAPWKDLESRKAGWWIEIGVDSLVTALNDALSLSPKLLKIKGENGRRLVEEKYSIQAVAAEMVKLYDWILNKGDKPTFVHLY